MRLPLLCMLLVSTAAYAAEPASKPAEVLTKEIVQTVLESIPSDTPSDESVVRMLRGSPTPGAREASDWLTKNYSTYQGTKPLGLQLNAEGVALGRGAKAGKSDELMLHLFTHHASGKVIAYGLDADSIKRAYWIGEPTKDLAIEKTARDTQLTLTAKNAKPLDPIATVIVLELSKPPVLRPLAIAPQQDGSILLHSSEAIVKAKNLRYEPEPNKNTVGYWTLPTDYVLWQFKVDKAGTYDVEMLQGCGKNSGGSTVEVTIDDAQPLPMVVQDTGHFQNFIPRVIGQIKVQPGEHTLCVRVKEKKGVAVMDLRQVVLKAVAP